MYSYYENTSDFKGRIGAGSPACSVVDINVPATEIGANVTANLKVMNVLDTEIMYPTTFAGSNRYKGTLGRPRTAYVSIGDTVN